MKFIDTILTLLTAFSGVFSVYFAGHALSIEHPGRAWITAAALALLALALGWLTTRRLAPPPPSP